MRVIRQQKIIISTGEAPDLAAVLHLPDILGKFPVIVLCHGFGGNKNSRIIAFLAHQLVKAGFIALRFDFAGCGESRGNPEDLTISSQEQDLARVVAYTALLDLADTEHIGIIGFSMSGMVAVNYAVGSFPSFAALCLIAPAVNKSGYLQKCLREDRLQRFDDHIIFDRTRMSLQFYKEWFRDVHEKGREISKPSMIIHGGRDERCDIEDSRKLYALLNGCKRFIEVEGAGHAFSRREDLHTVGRETVQWFREQLFKECRTSDVPVPQPEPVAFEPVFHILDRITERYPEKTALICDGHSRTFRQLQKEILLLSKVLHEEGIRRGDTVGLLLPNCIEYAASFFAPLRLGAVSVPLNPDLPENELDRIVRDSRLRAVIVQAGQGNLAHRFVRLSKIKSCILLCDHGTFHKEDKRRYCNLSVETIPSRPPGPAKVHDSDPAVYMYTSGTLGPPKGIVLSHRIVSLRGLNRAKSDRLSDRDICCSLGGLYHNGKLFIGMLSCLCSGTPFMTSSSFHPEETLRLLHDYEVTFLHANPVHFGVLAFWEGFQRIPKLPKLKTCLSSGNTLDRGVVAGFQQRFGLHIKENYGITEVGGVAIDGILLPGVQAEIMDGEASTLFGYQGGEIVVSRPAMANGYLQDKKRTAEAFREGWFYTGDIGFFDATGILHVLCRKKNAVLHQGREVYPDEVIRVLTSHGAVDKAQVTGDNGRLKARVTVKQPCTLEELLKHCRKHLADYKIPQSFTFCRELPPAWLDAMAANELAQLPDSVKRMLLA